MNAVNESLQFQAEHACGDTSDDLIEAIKLGHMSQSDLMSKGQALESSGELRAASNLYALWVNHAPAADKHFALFNYAGMLQGLGRWDAAMEAYEASISLKSDFPQPYINLGLLFEKQGNDTQALQAWLRLVGLRYLPNPPSPAFLTMALNHIGRVQEKLKHYLQAEQALEESLSIDPKQPGVIQHWVHIRQKACQWPVYKPLPNVSFADMKRYTSPLAMLALTEEPAEQLLNSQSFVSRTYGFTQEHLSQGKHYRHPRLRVGYVSGDFREHAVGFLLPALLEGHGPEFELYAYDFSPEENTALRHQLKGRFDHFRGIHGLSDRQAAELILSDEIDILIDLHGLSSGARPGIFSLRPAPKQGTYLGFMGPSGMPWIDFVIADAHVLPEDLTPYFTEKPLYLNSSFIPMVSYAQDAPVLDRATLGLPPDAFVMASFGNTYKITPEMFDTWMRLLKRLPDAVLWLIDDNEASTQALTAHAQSQGISAHRLVFSPRTTHREFCGRLKLADVFLDTYPYNCGSTSNDVIHAGVPIVTMHGKTLVSRMGLSLLSHLGMEDHVTDSHEAYEDKVVELSSRLKDKTVQAVTPIIKPLNVGQALQALGKAGSPSDSGCTPSLSQSAPLRAFQICYSQETLQQVPSGFEVLDNTANERPDWREFWPIRNYLHNNELEDGVFYGFFSPRFGYKTGLDQGKVSQFVNVHGNDHDVLIFSPFWDLNSLFLNSFDQGEFFQPGLMACSEKFVELAELKIHLGEFVAHSENTVFSNYFVAKKAFWMQWLVLADRLFEWAESGDADLQHLFNQETAYKGSWIPQKIFLQERLVNLMLATSNWKSKSWSMFDLPSSVTPLHAYKSQALMANAAKLAFTVTQDTHYLDAFHSLKQMVWSQSGIAELAQLKRNSLKSQ
jgi:predicted O-linked N-acetylglucosamine transferase (SPINDLY family)